MSLTFSWNFRRLDDKTLANNEAANIRLRTPKTQVLARRKRMSLAESLKQAESKSIEVSKSKVASKPQLINDKPQRRILVHTEYVFRDQVTGKVLSRAAVGSLPHIYR